MTKGEVIQIPPRMVLSSMTFCRIPPTVVVFPSEANTIDQMNVVEVSGTLDFWNDEAEDIYKRDDGPSL
jgi:hypothetical protein